MEEFNLSFTEALELVMEGMFIRSNIMGNGIYLKMNNDTLVVVNGNNFHTVESFFIVSKNSFNTKWKVFNVANKKSIKNQ